MLSKVKSLSPKELFVVLYRGLTGLLIELKNRLFEAVGFNDLDKLKFDLLGVSVGNFLIDWSFANTLELGPLILNSFELVEVFAKFKSIEPVEEDNESFNCEEVKLAELLRRFDADKF